MADNIIRNEHAEVSFYTSFSNNTCQAWYSESLKWGHIEKICISLWKRTVFGDLLLPGRLTWPCLLRSSVSVSVSVWVIWRITNRQTFRSMPILNSAYHTKSWYDELQIGRLLKSMPILNSAYFTAWYAELRIGILLKVCQFLIRHTLPNADL